MAVLRYPIKLSDYDPRWPEAFELERSNLAKLLGDRVVAFEHIGSTSVPGLCGKPIVDISIAVRALDDALPCMELMSPLGYVQIPCADSDRYDLWRLNGKEMPTHIAHFMQVGTPAWIRPIAFREALRADAQLAHEYADLKRRLAEALHDDIRTYGQQKTDFIQKTVDAELVKIAASSQA